MTYYGLTGVMYQAEDSHIKKGGEACIYKVIDKPDLLLKIYHSPARQQEQKLKVLLRQVTHWSSQFLAYCTIPIDLIYEADPRNGNARFVGYLMNRLPGNFRELQEIYDRIHGADVSYPNKVTAAMNVCTLTYLAHENHVVIGDYQQKNIGVANNGILTLFDNDSFQIQEKGRTYRCTVGVPQEMAPEIYDVLKKTKSDLETVPVSVYTNETDLYTMALHIFHLLMNGAHPFSSRIEASALPESKTVSKVQLDFVQTLVIIAREAEDELYHISRAVIPALNAPGSPPERRPDIAAHLHGQSHMALCGISEIRDVRDLRTGVQEGQRGRGLTIWLKALHDPDEVLVHVLRTDQRVDRELSFLIGDIELHDLLVKRPEEI